jgi:predicted cupin superfamily sugar epimerase
LNFARARRILVAMPRCAGDWIKALDLAPHPEGGHYRETYRSVENIPQAALPRRYGGDRRFSTAIYYLLAGREISALHRIKSDEIWHFYAGTPLELAVIDPEGRLSIHVLGPEPSPGEAPQVVVPANCWFGARVRDPGSYALVGCTVAPGFDFADFDLGRRGDLISLHPQHRGCIERLTRPG